MTLQLCKHIAATMFRYEIIKSKADKNSVISYIEGLEDNEAKALLLNLTLENSAIRAAIVATDSYRIENLDLDTLKASIDYIIEMIENDSLVKMIGMIMITLIMNHLIYTMN